MFCFQYLYSCYVAEVIVALAVSVVVVVVVTVVVAFVFVVVAFYLDTQLILNSAENTKR